METKQMLFSSMTFLWFFLPAVFFVHSILPYKFKNVFLLLSSLLFYSWGEPIYILLMLSSILINYLLALWINCIQTGQAKESHGGRKSQRRGAFAVLIFAVLINVGLLWYFKYYSTFASGVNSVLSSIKGREISFLTVKEIALPLGISFYTFQILSYVIDVYKKKCSAQKNLINFALYVSFFPQLVAGPIVQYKDVERQIKSRQLNSTQIAEGIRRFIYGLSKKVLLANTIASVADSIFAIPIETISSKWLWIGTFLYTLQIYYDFSGYSDMAIGLGKMFGFDFLENFNYPYISSSIREFWRRWHISLSSWFKEYIYIPLGGNRKGKLRTYLNLSVVFVVTGIWHGATLNYLLWGCYHGLFSLLERGTFGRLLDKNRFKLVNHIYTLFVVAIGWAIFRCDSLINALQLLKHMFVWSNNSLYTWYDFFSIRSIVTIVIAILLVGFFQRQFQSIRNKYFVSSRAYVFEVIWQAVLLIACIVMLIGGQYNPFIYFKF